jgi:DNA glycosylase AlkZ-like
MKIVAERLSAQHLAGRGFRAPADVVRWFGAVQAQDYPGSLWALGMRTAGATEASVEEAVSNRAIVRTWPLRGTLHFAAPEDVRWMLAHFGPRTVARAAPRFKQLELDRRTLTRGAALIVKALEGGRRLTRPQLYVLMERAGIATRENRGVHILWKCAHDGLICFATRDGRQHTVALLDEWLPPAKIPARDEALAALAHRYFTSHGPATISDIIWWTGLAAADARSALEMARGDLQSERIDGAVYWRNERSAPGVAPDKIVAAHAMLLPPYDEYTVAYRDRGAVLDPRHKAAARNGIFNPTIVVQGRVIGTWIRQQADHHVALTLKPFAPLRGASARAVTAAAERYGRFLGQPVEFLSHPLG